MKWVVWSRATRPRASVFSKAALNLTVCSGGFSPHSYLFLSSVLPISAQAAGKPNIVLITLDSTRADRMGFLGAKAKLTPNLDGLARQSMVFEQAYSQAPLTVVSHATILTGTYPQTNHASEFGAGLAAALPFLPDLLRAGGYRTAAFVGSIALDPKNGLAPGFAPWI